jgi:hypothetical protein
VTVVAAGTVADEMIVGEDRIDVGEEKIVDGAAKLVDTGAVKVVGYELAEKTGAGAFTAA